MTSETSSNKPSSHQITGELARAEKGNRLDRLLAEAVPKLSRERLKALVKEGSFALNGKIIKDPSLKKFEGGPFVITLPPPIASTAVAQDIPLKVVFEDEHLIIIDKPAGLVVHPAAGHADGTLVNALLHHCTGQLSGIGGVSRPGIVHRIDKDTSGLMVAAKTDKAHVGLSRLFEAHDIDRRYRAITNGLPSPITGSIEQNIGRSPTHRKKMAVVNFGQGKTAITHYRLIRPLTDAALVECTLETGRTHQVRVHMSHIGNSLIGDPTYGSSKRSRRTSVIRSTFPRQALHAAVLGFIHPITGEDILCESEIPDDMQELLSELSV